MSLQHFCDIVAFCRKLLNELISLLEETIIHNVNDEHWDLIVEVRNEMQDEKEKITVIKDCLINDNSRLM